MDATTTAKENEAKALFRKGIEYEREGNHHEATRCYKRALKLDHSVDKKIIDEDAPSYPINWDSSEDDENIFNNKGLILRLQKITGPQTCFPEHSQQATHFSSLPLEVVLYIFRWVISNDLDLCTLEQCAAVCRGWYLCARDPDLWRRACSKFWPSNASDLISYEYSWRLMFIVRPSVLTIGCYISKITYVRQGEESFRDNTNGPSFNVVYYRYLRFFSNGRVLMVLSNNPPSKILHQLQTIEKAPFNVCTGHYQLSEEQLFVTVVSESNDRQQEINKKNGSKDNTQRKTTYKMVLTLTSHKNKSNRMLWCTNYEVAYQSRVNRVMITTYNVTNNHFPPFIFSDVKCYANESKRIL